MDSRTLPVRETHTCPPQTSGPYWLGLVGGLVCVGTCSQSSCCDSRQEWAWAPTLSTKYLCQPALISSKTRIPKGRHCGGGFLICGLLSTWLYLSSPGCFLDFQTIPPSPSLPSTFPLSSSYHLPSPLPLLFELLLTETDREEAKQCFLHTECTQLGTCVPTPILG